MLRSRQGHICLYCNLLPQKQHKKAKQNKTKQYMSKHLTQQSLILQKQGSNGAVEDIAVPLFLAVQPEPVIISKDKKSAPELESEIDKV